MKIDETREIFDLSDHCLMEVELMMEGEQVRLRQQDVVINCYAEANMRRFTEAVERDLEQMEAETINMREVDSAMMRAAETHIRKKRKVKENKREKGRYQTIWMTKEIEREIKSRKKFNRLKRNNLNLEIKEIFNKKYQEQKQKVKSLVKEEIYKHEAKITEEIKNDRNRKLWENINYLRGKNKKKRKTPKSIKRMALRSQMEE